MECERHGGLHVEYAERGNEYGILFIFSLFCEYIHLEYVRILVIYRVNQAEYVLHILAVASQEYVNIYSTHRQLGQREQEIGQLIMNRTDLSE